MRVDFTRAIAFVLTIGDHRHRVDRATYEAARQRERERLRLLEQQRRRHLWPRMHQCPTCSSSLVFVRQVARRRFVPRCGDCRHRLGWFLTEAEAVAAWNRQRPWRHNRRAGRA